MRKSFILFIFGIFIYCIGCSGCVFAQPAMPSVTTPAANQQQNTNSDNNEIEDELLNPINPSNPVQPDGSDIQQEKHYSQAQYEQIYRELPVPTFSFVHGIDPDQYYDMQNTAWSPYPLMRLTSPLYFKSITIQPGYYLLTPREYKGDWYLLFKEAGQVKYIVPVFDKSYTPVMYYQNTLPEVHMKPSASWTVKFLNSLGRNVKASKRKPAIQANIELTDLDNNFLLIELYYGPTRYKAIFKTDKF